MRRALLVFVALVSVSRAAWPQGNPLGPEFRVNTYTTNVQSGASVASDASGNFVVVWESNGRDGSMSGVFGQRYASAGQPLGPEFRVNTYTTNNQLYPSIGSDATGNFLVVWSGFPDDGSSFGIFGQRYASSGAPLGAEFRVNTFTTGGQSHPAVASSASGTFVVVWDSQSQDGSIIGIFGQRYVSTGAPLGPEFRINTYTTDAQGHPSVAADAAGNFVAVWVSDTQDGSYTGVFGQRYANSGAPLGPEFRINSFTTNQQFAASVAADASGNFVVVWTGYNPLAFGVFGQRYASSGAPLGPEFRVNTSTQGAQILPSLASDALGNFVVTWEGFGQEGSDRNVFGQRYAGSGVPLGGEFRVNTFTTSDQLEPSVSSDAAGNFVVAWQSYAQDGSDNGVFGQRYRMIVPVELQGFRVE